MKTVNLIAVAVAALFAEQILHELCHGIAALAVGAQWIELHLFAMDSAMPEGAGTWSHIIKSGNSAVVNIATGALSCLLFLRRSMARRSLVDVALLFFAAYSLFAGFGYLIFDAIFFNPRGENLGDWKKVIGLLGGGAGTRISVGVVGLAGYLATFFGFPSLVATLASNRAELRALTIWPFLAGNGIAAILSVGHPLGLGGVIIVALKYWMGFCGLFWAYFMASDKIPEYSSLDVDNRLDPRALGAATSVLLAAILLTVL